MPFQPISHVTRRTVDWLWPGRLPAGRVTMLDGDPGIGKSILTLDLCARVTTGQSFPDGAANPNAPAHAIVINAEDGADDVIVHRLAAAGADLQRVSVWNQEPGEPGLRLPSEVHHLDEVLSRTGAGSWFSIRSWRFWIPRRTSAAT